MDKKTRNEIQSLKPCPLLCQIFRLRCQFLYQTILFFSRKRFCYWNLSFWHWNFQEIWWLSQPDRSKRQRCEHSWLLFWHVEWNIYRACTGLWASASKEEITNKTEKTLKHSNNYGWLQRFSRKKHIWDEKGKSANEKRKQVDWVVNIIFFIFIFKSLKEGCTLA